MGSQPAPPDFRTTVPPGAAGVLAVLRRGTWFALVLAAIAGGATYLFASSAPPRYTASVTVLASQTGPHGGDLPVLRPATVDPSVYQTALREGGVAAGALADLLGRQPDGGQLARFQREIRMTTQQNDASSLLTISVTEHDPAFAARAANALADALVTWDRDRARESVARSIAALRQSIRQIDARLNGGGPPLTDPQRQELTGLRQQRQHQLDAAQAANDSAVVVGLLVPLSQAAPPQVPSGPKVTFLTLLAAILGLLAGYGVTAIERSTDRHLRDREDLRALGGGPVLAEFPPARRATPQQTAEAASFLRSGALRGLGAPPLSLAICSARSLDEKAGVTVSLAESVARSGFRTLLVDADLRQPSTSYGLDVSRVKVPPLEVYLENPNVKYQPASVPIGRKRAYDFVPSFTSASYPVELLNRSFGGLLEAWRETYDVIIVDCPPVLPFADTLAVAPLCDGLVLCARRGVTTRRDMQACLERLGQLDVTIVGTALLGVADTRGRQADRLRAAATAGQQAIDPYRTLSQGPGLANVRVEEHHPSSERRSP